MSGETVDIRHTTAAAIMDAIIASYRVEGSDESMVNPTEALQSLIAVIGMMVEADPTITTPKEIREISESVGKQVRRQILVMRNHYDRTGERAWRGTVNQVQ